MNSSPAHTQPAVPAADSVSGTPDAPAWTGYVPGPDTLRAETDFAGTNFANPAFAETAFADGGSAPFSVAATGAAPSEWRDTTSAAIFGAQSTPRGTRAHSARTASAARGKRPFPEFRAAARRHLRHAALPQPGRRAHAAGPHLARRGHGQTLLRGPGRKRLLAFPEHRHRHRPALSGRRGGQIRRHADARPGWQRPFRRAQP